MHTYTGGCHCGTVRYQVDMELKGVMTCNCSHCSKKAFALAFVPAAQFTLLSGEDNITEYQFNKKLIHHLFCKTCGVQSFGRGPGHDGKEMVMINVHCLDGIDYATLPVTPYNGKDV